MEEGSASVVTRLPAAGPVASSCESELTRASNTPPSSSGVWPSRPCPTASACTARRGVRQINRSRHTRRRIQNVSTALTAGGVYAQGRVKDAWGWATHAHVRGSKTGGAEVAVVISACADSLRKRMRVWVCTITCTIAFARRRACAPTQTPTEQKCSALVVTRSGITHRGSRQEGAGQGFSETTAVSGQGRCAPAELEEVRLGRLIRR
eukprot:2389150-Pleurochrysis_carterae.AAC.2